MTSYLIISGFYFLPAESDRWKLSVFGRWPTKIAIFVEEVLSLIGSSSFTRTPIPPGIIQEGYNLKPLHNYHQPRSTIVITYKDTFCSSFLSIEAVNPTITTTISYISTQSTREQHGSPSQSV